MGEAWLFWAGMKQKCRVGVGGGGKCRMMGRKYQPIRAQFNLASVALTERVPATGRGFDWKGSDLLARPAHGNRSDEDELIRW